MVTNNKSKKILVNGKLVDWDMATIKIDNKLMYKEFLV